MKKIIKLLCVLILVFALNSCGKEPDTNKEPQQCTVDTVFTNSISDDSQGGIYIFKSSDKNVVKTDFNQLIIYNALDYSSDEEFVINISFEQSDLTQNDDFASIGAQLKGEYRIVIEHEVAGLKEKLVLRDWSKNYDSDTIYVSSMLANLNIDKIYNAQVIIELKKDSEYFTYLPIKSLFLSTDSTIKLHVDNIGLLSKQDILKMMSMTWDGNDSMYDDAAQKMRYAKLNDGGFPPNYWRTNGEKLLYRAYKNVTHCD